MKQLFSLTTICAALFVAASASAAPAPSSATRSASPEGVQQLLAREAQPGDDRRGDRRNDGRGHRATGQEPGTELARAETNRHGGGRRPAGKGGA